MRQSSLEETAQLREHRVGNVMKRLIDVISHPLGLIPDVEHQNAQNLIDIVPLSAKIKEREPGNKFKLRLFTLDHKLADIQRYIAEIDLHRAGRLALVANRAVVGYLLELFEMPERQRIRNCASYNGLYNGPTPVAFAD